MFVLFIFTSTFARTPDLLGGCGRIRNEPHTDPRALLRKIRDLVVLYRRDTIVVEDYRDRGSRRRERVRKAIENVASLATGGTEFCLISASVVRQTFGGGATVTKHAVATALAEHFPELAFPRNAKRG